MKRWMGWMLVGSLAVGGAALAQDDAQQQGQGQPAGQKNPSDESMFPMGDAEPIDKGEGVKDAIGGEQKGTGGSGQQQAQQGHQMQMPKGAQADAEGKKLMEQGLLPIPTDENEYLSTLHHANQMEVQLGQLAQQKGVSKGVKDYGAKLMKDHQQADEKLMTYAQKKNLQLGEPKVDNDFKKTMKSAMDAEMAKLQALEGPAFDRAFLAHMVGHHDADIAKVMAGQQQFASNTELKKELDSLLPTLKQHRQQAHRLLGQEAPRQARKAPQGR